jgi:hypothetical protein
MDNKLLGSFDQNKRKCCACDEYFDKDDHENYKWDEKLVSRQNIDNFYERYHDRIDTLFHKRKTYCPNCFEKKYELDLEVKAKSILNKAPPWLKIDD